jgi:plasmid maintenance system killer protein
MDIECSNKKLQKIYEEGRSSRKYRLPESIIDRFIMRVDALIAAESIHDLRNHPAINFEKLKGIKNGYSVMIHKDYRLEMIINWVKEGKTVDKIIVLDITNHSKKLVKVGQQQRS